ncbi:MAG: response regulator [Anaeromyxobacteraceae bacterium]
MSGPAPRILIVDDLVEHRELLSQVLADLGYEVATASDGRAALDAIRSGARPRLVLLDHWMPRMDGTEFLHHLRSDSDPAISALPVVVMTADPDGITDLLARTPPDTLLEKPFGLRELRKVVLRFCGQGSAPHRGAPVDAQ